MNRKVRLWSKLFQQIGGELARTDEVVVPAGTRVSLVHFSATASVIPQSSIGNTPTWGSSPVAYADFPKFEIYESASSTDVSLYFTCSFLASTGRFGPDLLGESFSIEIPGMGLLLEDGLKFAVQCPSVNASYDTNIVVNLGYMA